MFDPENDLERAMLRAASLPSAITEFYQRLLTSEVIVLGTAGDQMVMDMVQHERGIFHAIFTSPARLDAFSGSELPRFTLNGRTLFEATRGARFVVNPRSPLAKMMHPDEIAWCLANFRSFQFSVVEPDPYPAKLIKALCVLFANRKHVQAARMTCIGMPGNESHTHIIVGVQADGDIRRLVQEIFDVAAVADAAYPVDVASLETARADHPLHQHLLSVSPFFNRQRNPE